MLTHLQPSPATPARVVILGANGFIARAVTARLNQVGLPVLVIPSGHLDLAAAGSGEKLALLLEPGDAVVMTSAITPDKGRDIGALMTNLRMAESVATALAARPCAHFIYLSSDAVYDWLLPLISEAVAPSPTDLYSTMHITREQMLSTATAGAKVPYCVLRPCAIYGPGDTHGSYGPSGFARTALAEGRIKLFGIGEEMRDHVSVDDVVAIIECVLHHRSVGTLNVVSGRSIAFGEVAALIAASSTRPVVIEHLPSRRAVTHRHFDPSALFRSFPAHRPTDFSTGVRRFFAAL